MNEDNRKESSGQQSTESSMGNEKIPAWKKAIQWVDGMYMKLPLDSINQKLEKLPFKIDVKSTAFKAVASGIICVGVGGILITSGGGNSKEASKPAIENQVKPAVASQVTRPTTPAIPQQAAQAASPKAAPQPAVPQPAAHPKATTPSPTVAQKPKEKRLPDSHEISNLVTYAEDGNFKMLKSVIEKENLDIRRVKSRDSNNEPARNRLRGNMNAPQPGDSLLHVAIRLKNSEMIDYLLQQGVDVTLENQDGNTALHIAGVFSDAKTINALLDKGAQLEFENKKNETPYFYALKHNAMDNALIMKKKGAQLNARMGGILLCHALLAGNLKVAEFLINDGVDVNVNSYDPMRGDRRFDTPLSLALEKNYPDIIRLLLAKDVDFKDKKKELFTWVASEGHLDILKTLEQKGVKLKGETYLLAVAAEYGRLEIVQYLVANEYPPSEVSDGNKETPLHMAAQNGHDAVAKYLVENGANIYAVGRIRFYKFQELTPLQVACRSGKIKIIEILLANGEDPDNKRAPLYEALAYGHAQCAEFLLSKGAKPNPQKVVNLLIRAVNTKEPNLNTIKVILKTGKADINGRYVNDTISVNSEFPETITALYFAVELNNLEVAKLLIAEGADVNAPNRSDLWGTDRNTKSILGMALLKDNKEMIELLKSKGAKLDNEESSVLLCAEIQANNIVKIRQLLKDGAVPVATARGGLPLGHAAKSGSIPILNLLLENGADPSALDPNNGSTALHAAINSGKDNSAKILVEKMKDISVQDKNGNSPLHRAVFLKNQNMVEMLLAKGAKLNQVNKEKFTPLHLACFMNTPEIVEILAKKGADLNTVGTGNATPLHTAVSKFSDKCIAILLAGGADTTLKNERDQTPYDYAIQIDQAWADKVFNKK